MRHTYNQSEVHILARDCKQELVAKMFGFDAQAAAAGPVALSASLPDGSGIVGVGYGTKRTSGATVQGQASVRVYVRAKVPKSDLSEDMVVPSDINGTPTDVIAVGDIFAFAGVCGASAGHFRITAGTLGCIVKLNGDDTKRFILSNNHVLADSNAGVAGDDIIAPGRIDGGIPPAIAKLSKFQPIDFAGPNDIDAAIAELIDPNSIDPSIPDIGDITGAPQTANLHQSVRKKGRTTLHTIGVVTDLSASIKVRYGGQLAFFEDQIGITGAAGPFSAGGDSGSLIVDGVGLFPLGLLFAGGSSETFANPIQKVLDHFGITIL